MLDIEGLNVGDVGKILGPQARRTAVAPVPARTNSVGTPCLRLLGLSRSVPHYASPRRGDRLKHGWWPARAGASTTGACSFC